jgi:hypothetical protein
MRIDSFIAEHEHPYVALVRRARAIRTVQKLSNFIYALGSCGSLGKLVIDQIRPMFFEKYPREVPAMYAEETTERVPFRVADRFTYADAGNQTFLAPQEERGLTPDKQAALGYYQRMFRAGTLTLNEARRQLGLSVQEPYETYESSTPLGEKRHMLIVRGPGEIYMNLELPATNKPAPQPKPEKKKGRRLALDEDI